MCKGNHFCAHNEANLSFFGFFIQFIKKKRVCQRVDIPSSDRLLYLCHFLNRLGKTLSDSSKRYQSSEALTFCAH